MKRLWLLFVLAFALVACGTPSQEYKDQQTVNDQQTIYASNQPIPMFDWSMPRDVVIQIYKQKNQAISTWTVFFSDYGTPLYSCPSRGYPIEGGTELTNPQQITYGSTASGGSTAAGVIAQADPDGLYHPATSAGTYVLCVRPNGDIVPVYSEPPVMTFAHEVKIVNGHIEDVTSSPSTATIDLSRKPKVLPTPTAQP